MKNSNIDVVTGDAIIALSTGKCSVPRACPLAKKCLLRGH
jgi:hypothetical protein